MIVLGFESSCDETAAAVVEGRADCAFERDCDERGPSRRCTAAFVPEIASRRHAESISMVADKALADAGMTMQDIDAVAVTFCAGADRRGAGGGELCQGAGLQRRQAAGAGAPPARTHCGELFDPPGSGTAVFYAWLRAAATAILSRCRAGAATVCWAARWTTRPVKRFDKVARTLGLPYPGGPSVSQAARDGDPHAYKLPVPHVEGKYNVSFSGLKTAVINEVHNAEQRGEAVSVADMAASFQERIAQILAKKLLSAAADTGAKTVCLAGGVAANGRLRQLVNDGAQKLGAKVLLPALKYCGDNAAMIAAQGYYEYRDGNLADLSLNGLPTLPIDYR